MRMSYSEFTVKIRFVQNDDAVDVEYTQSVVVDEHREVDARVTAIR